MRTEKEIRERVGRFLSERRSADGESDYEMVRMYNFALEQMLWALEDDNAEA